MASAAPAKTAPPLPNAQKVAILLMALGDDLSSALLREMAANEVDAVMQQMMQMGNVREEERRRVVADFLALISRGNTAISGGMATSQRLLEKAFGADDAASRIERLTRQTLAEEERGSLRGVKPESIAQLLVHEHPQAMALMLTSLRPEEASSVLAALPADVRSGVALRLASIEQVSPELADQVAGVIEEKIRNLKSPKSSSYSGSKALASLFAHLSPEISDQILTHIEERNNDLAESVRSSMFTFDDILDLDAPTMALLTPRIERKLLTVALKGASDELRAHLMQTMSQRAKAMLLEDIEALGPVRVRDVEEAQRNIAAIIRELDRSGVISVRDSADGFIT